MKNIVILATLGILSLSTLNAQEKVKGGRKNPCENTEAVFHKRFDSVDLSSDQQTKIKAIQADLCKNLDPLRAADGKIAEANKEKAKQLRQQSQKDIKALLTPAQQEKMKSLHKEKSKGAKHGPKEHKKNQARKTYLLDSLGLTPTQKTQVSAILDKSEVDLKAVRSKHKGNKDSMKAEAKAIHKNTKTEIDKVLTEAQKKQLKDKFKKEHKPQDPSTAAAKMTAKMKTELSLTPEQEPRVLELNKNLATNRQALMEKYKGDKTAVGFKEEHKTMMKNHREALKKVLTPAQQELMKTKAKEKHGKK